MILQPRKPDELWIKEGRIDFNKADVTYQKGGVRRAGWHVHFYDGFMGLYLNKKNRHWYSAMALYDDDYWIFDTEEEAKRSLAKADYVVNVSEEYCET